MIKRILTVILTVLVFVVLSALAITVATLAITVAISMPLQAQQAPQSSQAQLPQPAPSAPPATSQAATAQPVPAIPKLPDSVRAELWRLYALAQERDSRVKQDQMQLLQSVQAREVANKQFREEFDKYDKEKAPAGYKLNDQLEYVPVPATTTPATTAPGGSNGQKKK